MKTLGLCIYGTPNGGSFRLEAAGILTQEILWSDKCEVLEANVQAALDSHPKLRGGAAIARFLMNGIGSILLTDLPEGVIVTVPGRGNSPMLTSSDPGDPATVMIAEVKA